MYGAEEVFRVVNLALVWTIIMISHTTRTLDMSRFCMHAAWRLGCKENYRQI